MYSSKMQLKFDFFFVENLTYYRNSMPMLTVQEIFRLVLQCTSTACKSSNDVILAGYFKLLVSGDFQCYQWRDFGGKCAKFIKHIEKF